MIGLAVATAASAGSATAATAPTQSAAKRPSITVGSLTLPPCATSTLAWCTTVQVPFDYADPAAGTIGCAEGLVRTFIDRPNRLNQMDAACAGDMPEVHVVGTFPRTMSQVTPTKPGPGNQAGADARRLAAVGAAVVGDSIWHWWYVPGDSGRGLRGGTWQIVGGDLGYDVTLTNVNWTDDTRVTGTGTWDQETGHITASVTVTGPDGLSVSMQLVYEDYEPGSVAAITGAAGGKALVAAVPAP